MDRYCVVLPKHWVCLPPTLPETLRPLSRVDIQETKPMTPDHINPLHWNQSLGLARQSCARIFRDGGAPADAMRAFGLATEAVTSADWGKAVDAIAEVLCQTPDRRVA